LGSQRQQKIKKTKKKKKKKRRKKKTPKKKDTTRNHRKQVNACLRQIKGYRQGTGRWKKGQKENEGGGREKKSTY